MRDKFPEQGIGSAPADSRQNRIFLFYMDEPGKYGGYKLERTGEYQTGAFSWDSMYLKSGSPNFFSVR